jgi:hypothetical protein
MCVAIVKKPTGIITDTSIENSFYNNADGAGYAFMREGHLTVKKGFFTVKRLIEEFRDDEERYGKDANMLLHFRAGTGGTLNADNCHPFLYKHGAFMHNGYFYRPNGSISDTNSFVKDVGDLLTKEKVEKHKAEMEKLFGGGNKVSIMYLDGSYTILNEGAGSWENDCWYSNTGYKYAFERDWRGGGRLDVCGVHPWGD